MNENNLEQFIIEGIKGLPFEALAEIADFIYFVRKRISYPSSYLDELYSILLDSEIKDMENNELKHLEKEFEDYDKLYPTIVLRKLATQLSTFHLLYLLK